jgi:Secretion system C-terminal sorting domain
MINSKTLVTLLFYVFLISSSIYSQKHFEEEVHANIYNINYKHLNEDDALNFRFNTLLDVQNSKVILEEIISTKVVDSVVTVHLDGSIDKTKYMYNSNGKLTSEVNKSWNGTNWVNSNRKTFTYDSNGNETSWLSENWDDTNWVNYFSYTKEYDSSKNLTSWLYEDWEDTKWIHNTRRKFTYDSNNNITSFLYEEWDANNLLYINRTTYTYDPSGNIISGVIEKWNETDWETISRGNSTNDSNGNMISWINESWNGTNWVNSNRKTFTYDSNGNETSWLSENWIDTNWINYSSYTRIYDSNGNQTLWVFQTWDDTNWVTNSRRNYTYDSDENIIAMLYEIWDGENWSLGTNHIILEHQNGNYYSLTFAEIEIFYKTITDVKNEESTINKFSLSQNYPNPFNPTTTIHYSIPSTNLVQLKVYNILGAEVASLINEIKVIGNYKVSFDASTLSSGIYFYSLQTEDYKEIKKLILLK